jgi:NACHT domain
MLMRSFFEVIAHNWQVVAATAACAVFVALLRPLILELIATLQGSLLFSRWTVARYASFVKGRYGQISFSFRPLYLVTFGETFVELELNSSTEPAGTLLISEAVRRFSRVLILGEAGSGKSELLRHVVLSWSSRRLNTSREDPIPVLVDLTQAVEYTDRSFLGVIEQEFLRGQFRQPTPFINARLREGSLLILLDGFQSVSPDRKARLVEQLHEFARTYPRSRFAITCRSDSYAGELSSVVTEILQIQPLTDLGIQQLAESFSSALSPNQRVELPKVLLEHPHLSTLARNPLMATLIAYVFVETPFVLPRTRPELYATLTTFLLQRWGSRREHRFGGRDKQVFLEWFGLYLLDNPESIMGRAPDDSEFPSELTHLAYRRRELFEEIEKGGLLIHTQFTGYQFPHKTVMEYFAALRLRNDERDLLRRYERDRNTWREVVKFCCGVIQHPDNFILSVNGIEPTTALECLADARSASDEVKIGVIIDVLKILNDPDTTLINSPSVVVLSEHSRQYLLKSLDTFIGSEVAPSQRQRLMELVTQTTLPKAAQILARYSASDPQYALRTDSGSDLGRQRSVASNAESEIHRGVVVSMAGRSGFYVNQTSTIEFAVHNPTDANIQSLILELVDTPEYRVVEPAESVRAISNIPASRHEIVRYALNISTQGTIALHLKVNNRFYQPVLRIQAVADNPYIYGPPVVNALNFFGRDPELKRALNNIHTDGGAHTLIVGEQRSGKTSLLYRICDSVQTGYVPVMVSLSGIPRDEREALEWLLAQLYDGLRTHNLIPTEARPIPLHFNTDFITRLATLRSILDRERPGFKIAILLDEAHILNRIGPIVQEVLREAFTQLAKDVRVVMACYYDFFDALDSTGSPLTNIFEHLLLKPLTGSDLEQLIIDPAARFDYSYQGAAVTAITGIAGGHPYYSQYLCALCFGIAEAAGEREITTHHVETAERQLFERAKEVYKGGYWDNSTVPQRLLLRDIAQGQGTATVSESVAQPLVRKSLLTRHGNTYQFTASLFKRWSAVLANEYLPAPEWKK